MAKEKQIEDFLKAVMLIQFISSFSPRFLIISLIGVAVIEKDFLI